MRGCLQSIALVGSVLLVDTDEQDENGLTLPVDAFFHEQSFYYDSASNPSAGWLGGITVHVRHKNFDKRVDNDTTLLELFKDKIKGGTDNFFVYHMDNDSPEYMLVWFENAGDFVALNIEENKLVKHDEDLVVVHDLTELVKVPTTTSIRGIVAISAEPICWRKQH